MSDYLPMAVQAGPPTIFLPGLSGMVLIDEGVVAPAFAPTDIEGLVAWFDASDLDSISISGNAVTEWRDKSGNDRHLAPGASPSSGTRSHNSLNVIDFTAASSHRLTRASVTVSQPYTIAVVQKYDAGVGAGTTTVPVSLGELAAYGPYIGDQKYRIFNGTVLASTINGDTDVHQWTGIVNGASSEVRIDGSSVASGNAGATAGSRINVGAANSTGTAAFDGFKAELCIYEGVLTGEDLSNLEEYLRAKWATPVTMDSTNFTMDTTEITMDET